MVFDCLLKLCGVCWIVVGCLDVNICGLLLFIIDGELVNCLMYLSCEVECEYVVCVFGQVDDVKLCDLSCGVQLEDGLAVFKIIKFSGGEGINQWYNVILIEGCNCEVCCLWEVVGVQVSCLICVCYGDILLLKGLLCGGWMELDFVQINYLCELVELLLEISFKVVVEKDCCCMKVNQICCVVKCYSQVSGGCCFGGCNNNG